MDELLRDFQLAATPQAFEAIMRRYLNAVYSQALRQVRDPATADDVTQAVFILLHRKAKQLGSDTILSAWLFRATRYACLEAQRAAARRRRHAMESAAMREQATPSDDQDDIRAMLDDAVAELSRQDREVLLLRYYDNRSSAEVGQQLGISDAAVRQRLSRAVDRLRTLLGRRGAAVPSAVILMTALETAYTHEASAHLAGSVLSAATGATTPASHVTLIAEGAHRIMYVAKLKLAAMVAVGLLLAGSAVPIAIHALADTPEPAPQPATAPVATPAPAAPVANGTLVKQALDRLAEALRSGNYEAACASIYSPEPDDVNLFKAGLRQSIAMDTARAAAVARFGDTQAVNWDTGITMREAVDLVQSILSDNEPATIKGDTLCVTLPDIDFSQAFGNRAQPAPSLQAWSGAPIYLRRVQGQWVWDIQRTTEFDLVGFANHSADPLGKEREAVAFMDLISQTLRELAADIRDGKLASADAVGPSLTQRLQTQFRSHHIQGQKTTTMLPRRAK